MNCPDFDYVARKIIAAAEVGLPTAQEVRGIMRDDWLHQPTIDRCAQRAHDFLKDHGYEAEAIECATAIRALKDKP